MGKKSLELLTQYTPNLQVPSHGVFTESSVKGADQSYAEIMIFPELELGRRAGRCEAKLDSSKVLQ